MQIRHRACDSPEQSYGDNGICSLSARKPVVEEPSCATGPVIVQNRIMGTADVPRDL